MCDHCGCRAFPPIARLTAEHEEILRLAWPLAEAARIGKRVDREAVAALLAVLDPHVVAEEVGLYPLLRETGDLLPVQSEALEDEHRTLRASLLAGTFDRREYYALAAHIEEEEMELFPSAMFAFDDDVWDVLAAAHPS